MKRRCQLDDPTGYIYGFRLLQHLIEPYHRGNLFLVWVPLSDTAHYLERTEGIKAQTMICCWVIILASSLQYYSFLQRMAKRISAPLVLQ